MMIPKLVIWPFLIPTWAHAQVLWSNTILVRKGIVITPQLIAHELAHVDQANRMGLWRYWYTYATLLKQYGYHKHPMELEAHKYERDPAQLIRARKVMEAHA